MTQSYFVMIVIFTDQGKIKTRFKEVPLSYTIRENNIKGRTHF
jgi:hypothetical protein